MTADTIPLPRVPEGTTIDKDNPWPGLLAYREEDSLFFHGRQRESDELLRSVMRVSLTVLFGQSGLGKSSLLQAGLFPRLRQQNVLPVYIRLDFSPGHLPLTEQVKQTITAEAAREAVEVPTGVEAETLWEYLHRRDADFWDRRNRLMMPLLVFDQFEEIFTLGKSRADASDAFLVELGDLIEGRPPARLKEHFDKHPEEVSRFALRRHHYKVLLSLREDFLPDLEGLRKSIPSIVYNRMRLRPMNGVAARSVVAQARHLIEPQVAEQVVRFVAAADEDTPLEKLQLDPAILSLFCRELNNTRLARGEDRITRELLTGSQKGILSGFYENSVGDMRPAVRTFVEEELLTESGYRDSVAEDNARTLLTDEEIDQLVNRRLVRREESGGVRRLELTHDVLIAVIAASREGRREREEEARQRRELQEAKALAAQKSREARRLLVGLVLALILAVISLGLFLYAQNQKAAADANAELARQQKELADQQKQLAEKSAADAMASAEEAGRAQQDALQQRDEAERQKRRADLARQAADDSASVAQQQRTEALAAQRRTERALQSVQEERERVVAAQQETSKARRQSLGLSLASKARRQQEEGENTLSAQLALEAFLFNKNSEREGDFLSEVYDALLTSLNGLEPGAGGPDALNAPHRDWVRAVAYSPDGRRVASTGDDGRIFLSAPGAASSAPTLLRDKGPIVRALAFSPTGDILASLDDDGRLQLFSDLDNSPRARTLAQGQGTGRSLAFSPDGNSIAFGGDDGIAHLLAVQAGGPQHQRFDPGSAIQAVALSPDGQTLATGTRDGSVHLWNVHTGGPQRQPFEHGSPVRSVAFSPDGQTLASGTDDGAVHLLNVGQNGLHYTLRAHTAPVNVVAFSPDPDHGLRLASGSGDHTVRLWDLEPVRTDPRSGISPVILDGHQSWVQALAFSPDGRRLVSGGADRTVRLWKTDAEELARTLCERLKAQDQRLSRDDWDFFVGRDIPFDSTYLPRLDQSCSELMQ